MSTAGEFPEKVSASPTSIVPDSTVSPAVSLDSSEIVGARYTLPYGTHWPSSHFVIAAGTVTFQLSTGKVVVVEDTLRRRPGFPRESWSWFLPRGRKDQDETLENCAIREAFEESGYRVTLLRASVPTLQPRIKTETTHNEAFHVQLIPYPRRYRLPTQISDLSMYMALWYLCTIPADAVRDADYGNHFVGNHEKGYNSELVDIAEAVKLLSNGRFEYRYSGSESKDKSKFKGTLVEAGTNNQVTWMTLNSQDSGAVEALIVASGWEEIRDAEGADAAEAAEEVRTESEWEDMEELTKKELEEDMGALEV